MLEASPVHARSHLWNSPLWPPITWLVMNINEATNVYDLPVSTWTPETADCQQTAVKIRSFIDQLTYFSLVLITLYNGKWCTPNRNLKSIPSFCQTNILGSKCWCCRDNYLTKPDWTLHLAWYLQDAMLEVQIVWNFFFLIIIWDFILLQPKNLMLQLKLMMLFLFYFTYILLTNESFRILSHDRPESPSRVT